jgi:hypothetical protein
MFRIADRDGEAAIRASVAPVPLPPQCGRRGPDLEDRSRSVYAVAPVLLLAGCGQPGPFQGAARTGSPEIIEAASRHQALPDAGAKFGYHRSQRGKASDREIEGSVCLASSSIRRGRTTLREVHRARSVDLHRSGVWRWAPCVGAAWSDHHATAGDWAQRRLVAERGW